MGDHLFLNYICFFGQLLLINRGGIINPHLALYLYIHSKYMFLELMRINSISTLKCVDTFFVFPWLHFRQVTP